MQTERINLWHEDLSGYPIEAIEWAVETWGKTERQLPSCADIRNLLRMWKAKHAPVGCGCEDTHGTGYDINDCLWLFKRAIAITLPVAGKRRISRNEWIALFKELNEKREGGVPPAFRGLEENWVAVQ